MSGCIAEIAKHASFVFWHTKNAISQSPFRMLQTVCSSGNDLTHKLLLLRGFPVCLPVSSMLKLRLPQFLFYKTAPVFPWSVWFNRIIVIHFLDLGTCSCTFNDAWLKKRKVAFWRMIYESLDINYHSHFSGSQAWNQQYRLNQVAVAPSLLRS